MSSDHSAPSVRLGEPWPLAEPHPHTGWRQPVDLVTLPGGHVARIASWGDAVPGGYNGSFTARDAASGELLGSIEYQSARGGDVVLVAMVEVPPVHRRQGIAGALFMRLAAEFPGVVIRPGYTTPDGAGWWRKVSAASGYLRAVRKA